MKTTDFTEIQQELGYCFNKGCILRAALTHSSYNREQRSGYKDNERLEFIGDGFLDAVIGAELFRRLPNASEGTLTKLRSLIVCEKSLTETAKRLELGKYMLIGHGEEIAGGREKRSILADAVEAIIGAVYLDGGFAEAEELVLSLFSETIEEAIDGKLFSDYKSKFQEVAQSESKKPDIVYEIAKEVGPPHDKKFFVNLMYEHRLLGQGVGKSKKEAEQSAAKEALAALERRK